MQETNSVSKFAGKNLRDIQFEGKFYFVEMCCRNDQVHLYVKL